MNISDLVFESNCFGHIILRYLSRVGSAKGNATVYYLLYTIHYEQRSFLYHSSLNGEVEIVALTPIGTATEFLTCPYGKLETATSRLSNR